MNIDIQNLEVKNNRTASRFEIRLGDQLGVSEYVKAGNVYTFTHTEVPPAYQGQGIAKHLTQRALEMVRAEGGQVIPACSFVRAYIQQHPEYQPLVAHRRRQ